MPLPRYLWLHPDARLSDSEQEQLKAGVLARYGEGPVHEHADDDEDE